MTSTNLLAIAGRLLDGVHDQFVSGVGAPSAVRKGWGDFATEVDLALEKRLTAELFEQTGIEVHGEEFGGPGRRFRARLGSRPR